MEKWEIRPPLPQKTLNRSSPKFAWVITSLTPTYTKFHHDTITPFASPKYAKMRIKWRLVFWFFCRPTAKTPAPIFTLNTSNDVFSCKDVPSGDLENKILYFDPIFPQNENFWPIFDGTWKILAQKALGLTMGMFNYTYP